jgi:hypothetical protein
MPRLSCVRVVMMTGVLRKRRERSDSLALMRGVAVALREGRALKHERKGRNDREAHCDQPRKHARSAAHRSPARSWTDVPRRSGGGETREANQHTADPRGVLDRKGNEPSSRWKVKRQ